MKNRLFLCLNMIPLLFASTALTSCNNNANKVYVANNIDWFIKSNDEKTETFFPTSLTGDQVQMMIETKQDFVVYFHSKDCLNCQKVDGFFDSFLAEHPFQIYSFSAQSSDIIYISELYPTFFDVTPKIMFFKNGENVLTLSSSRYSSYRSFESALLEFCLKSKIYTAYKLESTINFLEKCNQFLIYFKDQEKIIEENYWPYYEYFRQDVFPIISTSNVPSLVFSHSLISSDIKDYLYAKYDLDYDIKTWAVYVDKDQQKTTRYNYQVDSDKQLFDEMLATNFVSH